MKTKSTNHSYFYINRIFQKTSVILVSTNFTIYKSILDMLSIYAILKLSIKMGFVFINSIPQLCVVNLKLLFLWANKMSAFWKWKNGQQLREKAIFQGAIWKISLSISQKIQKWFIYKRQITYSKEFVFPFSSKKS